MDDPQARHLDRPVRHLGLCRLRALHHLVSGRHRHHARRCAAIRDSEAAMENAMKVERPRTDRLGTSVLRRAGRGHRRAGLPAARSNVRFEAGQYLFREGGPADRVLPGPARPRRARDRGAGARRRSRFQTLGEGEIVGVSWLIPPYRWTFDATRARAGARHRHRRRLPAREVRGRPRSRLRDDEALRAASSSSGCRRRGCRLLDVYGTPA